MPFMRGPDPIRRTIQYLEKGKLILRPNVRIMSFNYNLNGDEHLGVRDFIFWYLPQVMYKNPTVQICEFKDITPTPFIQVYFDNSPKILMDLYCKSKDEILDHLVKILGKTETEKPPEIPTNPLALFGPYSPRHCMCEMLGQIPCPSIFPIPEHLRRKKIEE